MSWFDKKSWQLRRKIKDLQAELAAAEREGKYVLEQGLFFAELQEMGDNTMMVLGTAQHLDSEEENVVRNFLERNGFSVEVMRLDKAKKGLAAVEILPPEELTRCVARELKNAGYSLVDDSEQERPARPADKMLTLSAIIRATSALFAAHVHQLVIGTHLKMNMEGNRLLHWMPLVRDALAAKVDPETLTACRAPFIYAYNHYYGQLGQMENPEELACPGEDVWQGAEMPDPFAEEPPAGPEAETTPQKPQAAAPETMPAASASAQPLLHRQPRRRPPHSEVDAAHALARLYKALVGCEAADSATNAARLLEEIAQYFSADTACLLTRTAGSVAFSLQACGGPQPPPPIPGKDSETWRMLDEAVSDGAVKILQGTENGSRDSFAVALPLPSDTESAALLYLLQPEGFSEAQEMESTAQLKLLSRPFREFPDLLFSFSDEKTETAHAKMKYNDQWT